MDCRNWLPFPLAHTPWSMGYEGQEKKVLGVFIPIPLFLCLEYSPSLKVLSGSPPLPIQLVFPAAVLPPVSSLLGVAMAPYYC